MHVCIYIYPWHPVVSNNHCFNGLYRTTIVLLRILHYNQVNLSLNGLGGRGYIYIYMHVCIPSLMYR